MAYLTMRDYNSKNYWIRDKNTDMNGAEQQGSERLELKKEQMEPRAELLNHWLTDYIKKVCQ